MTTMTIQRSQIEYITVHTLWGWRRGESVPELMEAWDEFTIDQNLDGWNEACERAIASWGGDLQAHRYIDIHVERSAIDQAFAVLTLRAAAVT